MLIRFPLFIAGLLLAGAAHATEFPPEFKLLAARDVAEICTVHLSFTLPSKMGIDLFAEVQESETERVNAALDTFISLRAWHILAGGSENEIHFLFPLTHKWSAEIRAQDGPTNRRQREYCGDAGTLLYNNLPPSTKSSFRTKAGDDLRRLVAEEDGKFRKSR